MGHFYDFIDGEIWRYMLVKVVNSALYLFIFG